MNQLRLFFIGALLFTGLHTGLAAASQPNLVYFFVDDMGWGTIRANQKLAAAKGIDTSEISKLIMPNIDTLARGGINFTHAYGNPVCSPSRSCQQTGFHQGHTWADRNDKGDHKAMRTQDPTLGKMLAAAGYRNGMYGKWGYGGSQDPVHPVIVNPQTLPIAHGYHDCIVELHHVRAHTFLQPSLWYSHVAPDGTIKRDTTLRMNREVYPEVDLYADNYYAAGAIDFIRTEANGPSPFFVQVSFQVPHAPYDEIETIPGWFDDYVNTDTATWNAEAKQIAAMITLMDKRIGEIIAALRDPNNDGDPSDSVMDNTLLIFSSDNGGSDHDVVRFFNGNGHLSGFKGAVVEGGIRDPLVFYWEGVIEPGQSSDHKTCVTDILPTFCELAGIAPPVGVDGTSIAPLLTGTGVVRERPYFCYEGQRKDSWQWTVVRDNMKMGKDPKSEKLFLYNLDADESEQNNLAEIPEYEQIMEELQTIAVAENLEADDLYANVFPTWVGGDGADVNAASSWEETGEWSFDKKWPQSETPSENWIARVVNTESTRQTAYLNNSINTLGFEVSGNADTKGLMELTLKHGVTLTGRNEIRLAPYSFLKLNGGTLSSVRWVDVFKHATLQGTGNVGATLYNAGVVSISNGSAGMVVSGDYHQTTEGVLDLKPGPHPSLKINGKAKLGGILKCELPVADSIPVVRSFTILTASSVSGTFNNPDGLVRCGEHTLRIHYRADRVELERTAVIGSDALAEDFRYQADWDSIRSRYEYPAWFRDAKFGIFLHWGPYAVPAYGGEKYPKYMYYEGRERNGINVFKHHKETYGDHSAFGYKDFVPMFKAEKFDAEEWVALFKEAGARYVVPVAEHHDGYAMYASKHTRWNVVDSGPKKDTMRMLADATRAAGLKFGASSHFANHRGYFSKKNPNWDTNNPDYYDLYWKPVEKRAGPSQEFLDHWWDRTTDIIDQYEPDVLWFDFGLDKPGFESVHKRILAYYYNKGLEWNKGVVFQDKNMKSESFPEDLIVLDIERGRMSDIRELPWQTDTAVGKRSWGYVQNEEYKTSEYLLDELIDIVSKNGCLLLNIGPRADGTIPDQDQAILREMGAWLKLNGEAIYGTRPWKIFGEGPTKVNAGHHSESENQDNVAADIRFTVKGDTLYATALGWPKDGKFTIYSLAKGNAYESRSVKSVDFVSGASPVEWEQTNQGLSVQTTGDKPCEAAYVFRIQFKE